MAWTVKSKVTIEFDNPLIINALDHPYFFPEDIQIVKDGQPVGGPVLAIALFNGSTREAAQPLVIKSGVVGVAVPAAGFGTSPGLLNVAELLRDDSSLVLLGCPPWTRKGYLGDITAL